MPQQVETAVPAAPRQGYAPLFPDRGPRAFGRGPGSPWHGRREVQGFVPEHPDCYLSFGLNCPPPSFYPGQFIDGTRFTEVNSFVFCKSSALFSTASHRDTGGPCRGAGPRWKADRTSGFAGHGGAERPCGGTPNAFVVSFLAAITRPSRAPNRPSAGRAEYSVSKRSSRLLNATPALPRAGRRPVDSGGVGAPVWMGGQREATANGHEPTSQQCH
jgi:hypothetical protein